MPAAKGKQAISVVFPEELVAQLDDEASRQKMDRSALIVSKLQASEAQGPWTQVMIRLDSQDRALAVLQDTQAQLVTAFQEVLEALRQSPAKPAKEVYPTPATWEETYPDLYAPKVETPAPVAETPAEKKGWRPWRP